MRPSAGGVGADAAASTSDGSSSTGNCGASAVATAGAEGAAASGAEVGMGATAHSVTAAAAARDDEADAAGVPPCRPLLSRCGARPTVSGALIGLAQPAAGASSPLLGAGRAGADPVGVGPEVGAPPPPPGGRGAGRYFTVTPSSCSIASRR